MNNEQKIVKSSLVILFGSFVLLILMIPLVLRGAEIKASLESPFEGSFESGIGLIRGWVCDATKVEVQIDSDQKLLAGYGTKRKDTEDICGDTNNGFGLTYNWNSVSTGTHLLKLFVDGVFFTSARFKVTSLASNILPGSSYLTGISGDYSGDLDTGEMTIPIILHWSEPHQNFVIVKDTRSSLQYFPQASPINAGLESPFEGSFESGIGLIRGWVCNANKVEIQIDGGERLLTAYGTTRNDTAQVCGDVNNGFGLVYNWNQSGNGVHNLRAYADDIEFANVSFQVTTLGKDYLQMDFAANLPDFPRKEHITTVQWSNPHQNFVISDFQDHSTPTSPPPTSPPPTSPPPTSPPSSSPSCDQYLEWCNNFCGGYLSSTSPNALDLYIDCLYECKIEQSIYCP